MLSSETDPRELAMEAFMMPSVHTGVAPQSTQTTGHLRPSHAVHAPTNGAEAPCHGSVLGTWAALGASVALAQRGTRTARRSTETEKEAFDVWQPSTYGVDLLGCGLSHGNLHLPTDGWSLVRLQQARRERRRLRHGLRRLQHRTSAAALALRRGASDGALGGREHHAEVF